MSGFAGAILATPNTGPVGGRFLGGGVTLNADGSATVTFNAGDLNWYTPTTGSIGAGYWVRTTKTSGSRVFSPASGTWFSLSAGQAFAATGGAGFAIGLIDFATDSSGTNIVATGTISVDNTL